MLRENEIIVIVYILIFLSSLTSIYLVSNIIFRTYFKNKLKYKKELDNLKWEIKNGI